MEPIISHIQITVRDMELAVPFYDKFLPLLGFSLQAKASAIIESHDFHVVEYSHPRLSFAISSPRSAFRDEKVHRRRPGGLHHLAFEASSRAEVDALHEALKGIGAQIATPPREYPEYTPPSYYALFFKDPDGNKFEIVTHSKARQQDIGA